jgi:hypothetical protein
MSASYFPDAAASTILKGFLLKRGHFVKSWRKRCFILRGSILTYSVHEGSGDKGAFQLTKTTRVAESSYQPYCFCLIDGKRELFVVAEDEAEMIEWMEALQGIITAQSFTHCGVQTIGAGAGAGAAQAGGTRVFAAALRGKNTLTISLARAKGLSAKNKGNTSNPYVVLMVGAGKAKSSTVMGDLNPIWNETFTFPFDRTLRFSRIEIWDEDGGGKDRFLGLVVIPLFMLSSGTPHGSWFGLGKRSSRSRVSGELFVEVSCNVEVETIAVNMLKDICQLPELSLLPDLCCPGLINRNIHFNEPIHYFPGEALEDMAMHVILKAELGGECYYSNGVMMLTNYRLIFVGASKLNASRRVDLNPVFQDEGDICTYITFGSVVNVSIGSFDYFLSVHNEFLIKYDDTSCGHYLYGACPHILFISFFTYFAPIGEEPDYLNPSLSIETIRIKTCDARVSVSQSVCQSVSVLSFCWD